MRKNIIRFSEGQLRSVINESVRHILSELDWRTYQSAYEKTGNPYFLKAAKNSFNRQYGYGLKNVPYGCGEDDNMEAKGDSYSGEYTYGRYNDKFVTTSAKYDDNGNPQKAYGRQKVATTPDVLDHIGWKFSPGDTIPCDNDNFEKFSQGKGISFNPALKYHQIRGDKAVRDYFSGKSKYRKGKGWS